ncbi:MAG: hypothetical protein R6V56_09385 [Lentisphaeria bacterium]
MFRRVTLIFLIVVFTAFSTSGKTAYDADTKVQIKAPKSAIRQIHNLVDNVDRGVRHYLGRSKYPLRNLISVVYEAANTDSSTAIYNVRIKPNESETKSAHKLAAALLARRFGIEGNPTGNASENVESGQLPTASFQWLAAAIVYDAVERNAYLGTEQPPDYQAIFIRFTEDSPPDIKKILRNPADIDWPVIYRLWSIHCHLIANLISQESLRTDRSFFARYKHTLTKQPDSYLALETALKPILPKDSSLQDWYNSKAPELCLLYGAKRSPESTLNRLNEIMHIEVGKDTEKAPGGSHKIPLTQITELPSNSEVLRRKVLELLNLQREAPVLLRPALADYAKAVNQLHRKKKFKRFRRQITRARKRLNASRERLGKTLKYLDSMALEMDTPVPALSWYLQIIQENNKRRRQALPEVHEFLDEVRKR